MFIKKSHLIVSIFIAISLSACGGGSSTGPEPDPEPDQDISINSIKADPSPSIEGEEVEFSANMNMEASSCKWEFGDGTTSDECETNYTFDSSGEFTVKFTASNESSSDSKTLIQEVKNEESENREVVYVDLDATGNETGSSWDNAYTSLQDALETKAKQIWIAEGIYYPDIGKNKTEGNREASFNLVNDMEIYGGFEGNETNIQMRDWEKNETILSGDIGSKNDKSDNSFSVVLGKNLSSSTIIDGLTISHGSASTIARKGGGMHLNSSDVIIRNVQFVNNSLSGDLGVGGALYTSNGNPVINNCLFKSNNAKWGGAIYITNESDLSIKKSTFEGNEANLGAGLYISESSSTIEGSDFKSNIADYDGGGIYNDKNGNLSIKNANFENNKASRGGGIFNGGYDTSFGKGSSSTINKVNFISNTAESDGGGIANVGSNANIINCTFKINIATIGGGVSIDGNSNIFLDNSLFIDNESDNKGGGISIDDVHSSNKKNIPIITNVRLLNNKAKVKGGGIYSYNSSPILVNIVLSSNTSTKGGGLYNEGFSNTSLVINSTFANNTATDQGGGINSRSGTIKLTNSILWANSSQIYGNQYDDIIVSYSLIEGELPITTVDDGNNLFSDPKFRDASGPDGEYGTIDDDLSLLDDSPAINAGLNSALDLNNDEQIDEIFKNDIDGNARIQEGIVDIGAHETSKN